MTLHESMLLTGTVMRIVNGDKWNHFVSSLEVSSYGSLVVMPGGKQLYKSLLQMYTCEFWQDDFAKLTTDFSSCMFTSEGLPFNPNAHSLWEMGRRASNSFYLSVLQDLCLRSLTEFHLFGAMCWKREGSCYLIFNI